MAGLQSKINALKGGRPKGSFGKTRLIAQQINKKIAEMVKKELVPLIRAQIDCAKGIQCEAYDKDGNLYYKDPGPNTQAFKVLMEYVVGRPTEKHELTGPEGNPIEISISELIAKKNVADT